MHKHTTIMSRSTKKYPKLNFFFILN